jgi:hypothetical protein
MDSLEGENLNFFSPKHQSLSCNSIAAMTTQHKSESDGRWKNNYGFEANEVICGLCDTVK